MTAWVTDSPNLLDAELSQDEKWNSQKTRDLRDRDSYLFDSAMRGGTFLAPHRFAYARGGFGFSITLSGGAGSTSTAVTFSSAADDGNPNFDAAPRVSIGNSENTASGGISWSTNHVTVTAFVQSGTLTDTGMTVEIVAIRNSGSGTQVDGDIYWHAFGDVTSGE